MIVYQSDKAGFRQDVELNRVSVAAGLQTHRLHPVGYGHRRQGTVGHRGTQAVGTPTNGKTNVLLAVFRSTPATSL